jgi:4,5:9,10-diseco-3-hydroxy-5,9,17-trioxoandrosta-1(10),2-diene-4-oate hydrolase
MRNGQGQRGGETNLHYVEAGSGPPVVLLHGLLGGSFCWRLNLPVFSGRFTTYAVDLPGFGQCDAPADGDCGMQAQALRLLFWLKRQGLERVDVVASSWGGGVALLLAALSPACVRSLVLAAPVNPWSELGLRRVRFFGGNLGSALLRMGMPLSRPLHSTALKRMYGDPQKIPAGTMEGYSRMALRKGLARNIVATLRSWENDLKALRTAIERVQSPTLLIWGTRDGAVDLRSAEALRKKLPACELAIIEGAGHLPFEEAPEEFNRLTLDFLKRR